MKTPAIILIALAFNASALSAQTKLPSRTLEIIPNTHRQVAEINSLELWPAYVGGIPGQDWSDWRHALYFDESGRIRKCINQSRYPEGDGDQIYYFDTTGVAIFAMSRCNSGHDGDISIALYRNAEGIPRYFDYLEQWGDGSDALIEHTIINGLHEPVALKDNYTKSVEEMIERTLSWFGLKDASEITFSEYCFVDFEEPEAGEWTFVNRNKVPVYKKATESSLIVGHLKISDDILILKATRDWYKVVRPASDYEEHEECYFGYPEILGYIRREFVEPVEKIHFVER